MMNEDKLAPGSEVPKRSHGAAEAPDSTCEQPQDLHRGTNPKDQCPTMETSKRSAVADAQKREDATLGASPVSTAFSFPHGDTSPGAVAEKGDEDHHKKDKGAHLQHNHDDQVKMIQPSPAMDTGSIRSGWSDKSKGIDVEKKDLRIIKHLPVSSPRAVSTTPVQHNHLMSENTSQWDNRDVDSNTVISSNALMSDTPVLVTAEVVPEPTKNGDKEEENARMATEIAELQERLRMQENQDVIQAVPMTRNHKDGMNRDGDDDDDKSNAACWRRRRTWILFCVILAGGIIAVVVGVTASSSSGSGPRTPAPTMRPTHPPSPMPTAHPSGLPTITSRPTMFPSESPTLSPRTYLLQTLLPTVASDGFNTTDAWDAHLTAYPNTPQAKAITWMTEEDEYSATPTSLDPQELQERYALVVLYFSTSGPRWATYGSYYLKGTKSVCDWNAAGVGNDDDSLTFDFLNEGVYCDDNGSVYALALWVLSLEGTFPSEISLVQNLQSLDLSYNSLSGTLPSELGDLTKLKRLILDQNLLSGTLPSILPASLKQLWVSTNLLSGTLSSNWATSATNLVTIYGGDNDLEGTVPSEWSNFDRLEVLDISFNQIHGTIPTTLGLMTQLASLLMNTNQLSGSIPSEIGHLSNLFSLYLQSNPALGGAIPSEIGNLESARYIDMGSNAHTGHIPTTLAQLLSLYSLSLNGNQLSGTLPSEIGLMSSMLSSLQVQDNPQLSGTVPLEYANLSQLDTFLLYNTSLTGSLNSLFCLRNVTPSMMHADCLGDDALMECSCCQLCCSSSQGCVSVETY